MLLGRIKNAEGKSYTTGAAKIAAAKIKHVRYGVVAECFDAMVKGKEAVYDFFDAKRSAAGGRYGASRGLLLETRLQREFRGLGWGLLFTPPYSPKMQPIELLWRDTKNFCASEWFSSRSSSKQSIRDVLDFWFGAASTQRRGIKTEPLSPGRFAKYRIAAEIAMNEWIAMNGVRCSGTVANLSYNKAIKYKADGSIKADVDAVAVQLENGIETGEISD